MEGSPSLSPLSSPSDITTTWLEELLKKKLSSSVKINNWFLNLPETKNGFLSEVCSIKISFSTCGVGNEEKEEELSLFAKFLPKDELMLQLMKANNLGEREIEFYKYTSTEKFKVFCKNSGLHHPTPEVYLAELRENKLTLVLHDLKSDNFKLSIPVEGNSLQQIKNTLATIAIIHGSGVTTLRNYRRQPFNIPVDWSSWDDLLVKGINMQVNMLEGTSVKDTVRSFLSLSKEILTVGDKYPFVDTLIHGDLWTPNVMFSEGNQDACIFDWQYAHIGNLVCDIVPLLLVNGAPHTYTAHLTEILECYWESFEQSLKKNGASVDVTFQDLVRNVESMWMYGYMIFTMSIADTLGTNIKEDRVKAVIHFLEKRDVFKKFIS